MYHKMDSQSITALNIVLGNGMNELLEENKRLKEENEKLKKKNEKYKQRFAKVKTWLMLPQDFTEG